MNPDEVLRQARKALEDWEAAEYGSPAEWNAAERLSSAFAALDDWLSRGGFAPADWRQKASAS